MNVRNQKGAVAALVAVMLVLIMVCVAFVTDLGNIHNVKVLMQRAVDAGALAGAQQLPNATLAKQAAVAATNANMPDLAITVDDVEVGHWDVDALGSPASVRFVADAEPFNAVLVRADKDEEHIFFFFLESSDVNTDAIAIRESLQPILPVVFVSCIPTNPDDSVLVPGDTVCDIAYYVFASDPADTAGWSSLTFTPASVNNIRYLIDNPTVLAEMLFEGSPDNPQGGLEYEDVNAGALPMNVLTAGIQPHRASGDIYDNASFCRTSNNSSRPNVNIVCGLGEEFNDSVTLPDDPFDFGQAGSNSLPRWYHTNHFNHIITMADLLSPGTIGDRTDPDDYLRDLAAASREKNAAARETLFNAINADHGVTVPADLRDDRFALAIDVKASGAPDYSGDIMEAIYWERVLAYAGYPLVQVNNGVSPPNMESLLDLTGVLVDPDGLILSSDLNPPFDVPPVSPARGTGETLLLTVPVIFAGTCDFKFLGTVSNNYSAPYIGLANFLMTRVWMPGRGQCYEASSPIVVDVDNLPPIGGECDSAADFNPQLGGPSGDTFTCDGVPQEDNLGFEGLLKPPGEDDEAGAVVRIYLVE